MESKRISTNLYYLNSLQTNVKQSWNDKQQLTTYRLNLLKFRENNLKGFNSTFGLFGICAAHLGNIYYRKQVLHLMESRAFQHIGVCVGAGLASGVFFGQLLGKKYLESRKASKIEAAINERLSVLK